MTSTEQPQENVVRGALFALVALPVGAALVAVIYAAGYFAALAGLAIAFGAYWLYKKGAGTISVTGAVIVGVITILASIIGVFAGWTLAWQQATSLFDPGTAIQFGFTVAASDFWLSILFGVLGGAGVVAQAVRESKPEAPDPWQAATPGSVPPPAAGITPPPATGMTPPPYVPPTAPPAADPNAPKA